MADVDTFGPWANVRPFGAATGCSLPATAWPKWSPHKPPGVADAPFSGADTSTRLKLFGVDVASFGDVHGATEGALEVVCASENAATYAKFVLTDDAQCLLGGVLVGDASAFPAFHPLVGRKLHAPVDRLLTSSA